MNKNQWDVATEKYVAKVRMVHLCRLHDQIRLHNGFLSSKTLSNPSYQFITVWYLMEKKIFTNICYLKKKICYLDTNMHEK